MGWAAAMAMDRYRLFAVPFCLGLSWALGSLPARARPVESESYCIAAPSEGVWNRDSDSLCFSSEIELNYYVLRLVMEEAGFEETLIQEVIGQIQAVESEIADAAATTGRLMDTLEDYVLSYQAMTLIRIADETLFPEGVAETVGNSVDGFAEWSDGIASFLEEHLDLSFIDELGLDSLKVLGIAKGLLQPGMWGYMDIPLGEREGFVDYTISGSDREGWSVPCDRSSGCDHIELSSELFPSLHGRRWIGGQQSVRGGKNPPLESLNGGMEPTGRLPFHDRIKIVVDSVDESAGYVQFSAYLNFCISFLFYESCSPYFIGPLPWVGANEKDWVLVGLGGDAPTVTPPGIGTPPTTVPEPQPTIEPTAIAEVPTEFCRDLTHPAPGRGVTSEFGYRVHPVTGLRGSFHDGIDLGTPMGDPIHAACDGVVTNAQPLGGYGNYVVLEHGRDESGVLLTTGYAHLSSINVSVGQYVTKGQVVGSAGSTGISTGPHLHFQTFINSFPRNPREFINFY